MGSYVPFDWDSGSEGMTLRFQAWSLKGLQLHLLRPEIQENEQDFQR